MTILELFEKYKGYRANYNGQYGTICGYGESLKRLIIAVDEESCTSGWWTDQLAIIITHKNNKNGYYWINGDGIDQDSDPNKILPVLPEIAEKYIIDHFPGITDDEKDIYINIFMEGTKYITNDTK